MASRDVDRLRVGQISLPGRSVEGGAVVPGERIAHRAPVYRFICDKGVSLVSLPVETMNIWRLRISKRPWCVRLV